MKFHKCKITGRRWVSVWLFHVGFGPHRLFERVIWRGRLIWWNKKAQVIHRRIVLADQ